MATFHTLMAPQPEHLAAIGRVCVQWTLIEHALEFFVWHLTGLQQFQAQAITTELQWPALVKIAKTQVNLSLQDTDLEKRFKRLMNRLDDDLRPKRNDVVHGMWGPSSEPGKISFSKSTARGALIHRWSDPMSADDILKIAEEIDRAHFEFTQMMHEISGALARK